MKGRRNPKPVAKGAAGEGAETVLGPCPLCGRPMVDGPSVDRHHWLPRSHGGREATPLHAVCHRMIHRVLDDAELAAAFATADALRAHPEIAKFVAWVRRKPPTYIDWPRTPRRRRG